MYGILVVSKTKDNCDVYVYLDTTEEYCAGTCSPLSKLENLISNCAKYSVDLNNRREIVLGRDFQNSK